MATRQTLVMWTSVLAATAILMLAALVYAGASAVPCTWRHEPGKTLSLLKGDAVLWTLNLGPDHPWVGAGLARLAELYESPERANAARTRASEIALATFGEPKVERLSLAQGRPPPPRASAAPAD